MMNNILGSWLPWISCICEMHGSHKHAASESSSYSDRKITSLAKCMWLPATELASSARCKKASIYLNRGIAINPASYYAGLDKVKFPYTPGTHQ